MNYKTKRAGDVVDIEITLTAEEWTKALESAYNANKGKYKVEGFRPGKVPQKMIEKTYGADVFVEEALRLSFPKYYAEVVEKEKVINPVDYPEIEVKSINEKGVVILAKVDVMPEFTVEKYKGISVKKFVQKVTDADVDAKIADMRNQRARQVTAFAGKKIEKGDVAVINFEGFVDGKAFDGGKATNHNLDVGSHSFIDTFEDQLVGLAVGDKKDVKVIFPKQYHAKELAGKPAVFKVEVTNILVKHFPELNDEFAKEVSEFDTLKAFKDSIKNQMEAEAKIKESAENENRVVEEIIKGVKLTAPKKMVDRHVERRMMDMEKYLASQGVSLEQYAQMSGTTLDKLKEEQRADAERSVKTRLVLDWIITNEKLTVDAKEIDAEIERVANANGKKPADYKKQLNPRQIEYIESNLLFDKLSKFLFENNKLID